MTADGYQEFLDAQHLASTQVPQLYTHTQVPQLYTQVNGQTVTFEIIDIHGNVAAHYTVPASAVSAVTHGLQEIPLKIPVMLTGGVDTCTLGTAADTAVNRFVSSPQPPAKPAELLRKAAQAARELTA